MLGERIGLIVLGAGSSSRFGSDDKLAAELSGRVLAHHLLAAVDTFGWSKKVLVCREGVKWAEAYRNAGFRIIENNDAQRGMLSSLHAGLDETRDLPHTMICLADMPFITNELVQNLIEAAIASDADVVACRSQDYKGPPAIFRTRLLHWLPQEGEGGARSLLADATFIDFPHEMLRDIDTLEDLVAAQAGTATS